MYGYDLDFSLCGANITNLTLNVNFLNYLHHYLKHTKIYPSTNPTLSQSLHPTLRTSGLQSGAVEPPLKWFWARKKGELAMSRMG